MIRVFYRNDELAEQTKRYKEQFIENEKKHQKELEDKDENLRKNELWIAELQKQIEELKQKNN